MERMTPPRPSRAPADADPWRAARRVGRQLAVWALLSVAGAGLLAGLAAAVGGDLAVTLRALALQFVVWGAIDGVIAAFGERDRRGRIARGEHRDPAATRAFGARLRRLLRLNAGLDLVYVAVGAALLVGWRTPAGLGHGLGVLVQGGFLLVFDVWHGFRGAAAGADGDAAAGAAGGADGGAGGGADATARGA
jgi:hypothetical protein